MLEAILQGMDSIEKRITSEREALRQDIDRIVLWQNGKCLGEKAVGDTRYIRPEYRETEVKKFSFPKRTHALYVILENKEEAK
jgi:hypothetical protein